MTRRELLDAKMKREAEKTNCYENRDGCYEKDCFRRGYRSGSSSLAPMLLKLAEALEEIAASGHEDWCYYRTDMDNCACHMKPSMIALDELDKFLGG